MLIIFFDFFDLVHYKFVPTGRTVDQVFYIQVLKILREKVRRKRPEAWKLKSWFLHPRIQHFPYANFWHLKIYQ
jgi:hypothetical protein